MDSSFAKRSSSSRVWKLGVGPKGRRLGLLSKGSGVRGSCLATPTELSEDIGVTRVPGIPL